MAIAVWASVDGGGLDSQYVDKTVRPKLLFCFGIHLIPSLLAGLGRN